MTTSFSRRDLLKAALSAAAVSTLPGLAGAAETKPADARLMAMLGDFADEVLRLTPTTATGLGVDNGARAALKSQLDELSAAADKQWADQVHSMVARLKTVDRAALSPAAQTRFDTFQYAASAGVEGLRWSFGGAASGFEGGTAPFPITQQDGALAHIPEFLDSQHQITNAADAEAYLARVEALARLMDQESERVLEQAGQNIMPPDFICATALGQLKEYRATAIDKQQLVNSLVERTAKLGIAGDWQGRVTKLVEGKIYPALDRQIDIFAKATAKATNVAGVHRLPDGEAYYAWALKLGTTTTRSAQDIHHIGQEQNKALNARMDAILKAQGMTQGTVGERMHALSKDPSRFFADDDAGRAQLIAYCNERVAALRKMMPKLSHLGMQAPLMVKRVPQDIEAGAPLGYMNPASLDGSRPAIYYINLKSTKLWPKHELTTLSAHEGIPGHAWHGAFVAEHHEELPLLSSIINFNAFTEGWALYSEQLADEFGIYANDPFGQLGYLQAQKFRACRLVVDTGMHALKWSRQDAIRFLIEHTGRGEAAMTSEIDRYTVSPGQACGYKMGHNEILRQRDRAKQALGAKFDLAGFNDAVVTSAGVPLTVLPSVIDRFIAARKKA